MKLISNKYFTFPALVILLLLGRLGSLENLDLIDPTEARYAFVAQTMLLSDDWVTPKLLDDSQKVPYLGKPPLHFWLTALSYRIFGMAEWTSRLPSFLMALVCLLFVFRFAAEHLKADSWLAVLILLTSGLFFFFAGASVVDVTLTACSTAAMYFLFNLLQNPARRLNGIYFAAACAFGFLTKGPIALVLVILPALVWLVIEKKLAVLKKIPWFSSAAVFLLITAPWFVLAELKNPGFLKYFFINENFLRFVVRDYGDLYGSGHVYPRGSAIWMLLLCFLPWTVILGIQLFHDFYRQKLKFRQVFLPDAAVSYVFCWVVLPIAFTSLMRQLHAGYVVPMLPALALLTAAALKNSVPLRLTERFLFRFAGSVGAVYIAVAFIAPVFINQQRSTETMIKYIRDSIPADETPTIAIITDRAYSPYWIANTWRGELSGRVKIRHVDREDLGQSRIKNVLLKLNHYDRIDDEVAKYYELKHQIGNWCWMRRKA